MATVKIAKECENDEETVKKPLKTQSLEIKKLTEVFLYTHQKIILFYHSSMSLSLFRKVVNIDKVTELFRKKALTFDIEKNIHFAKESDPVYFSTLRMTFSYLARLTNTVTSTPALLQDNVSDFPFADQT